MQIHQINLQDPEYPFALTQISAPPKQLYVLGDLPKGDYVAIVGTRSYTEYGKAITYELAFELAKAGLVIVSGLALGIDGAAHQAALDAGGKTVAVLAGGLDHIYPSTHRELAKSILAHGGALISEYPAGIPTYKSQFVARNRIVVGLSLGTIITESAAQGGAMHSAHFTLDANRILMAVPGDINQRRSAGPNNLIHEGAVPIRSSSDVLHALNITANVPLAIVSARNPHEERILTHLQEGHRKTDQLIEATGLSAAEFASVISLMEITGKVRNLGAGVWAHR
ncbi:MAG TPA: DNA-processing protein DprA [Candidatus Saccharimonas sp.]|nr:DNA-processing protein DprA [Candidatus Saccharimonas sp.]